MRIQTFVKLVGVLGAAVIALVIIVATHGHVLDGFQPRRAATHVGMQKMIDRFLAAIRWLANREGRRWADAPAGCCECGTGGPYYRGPERPVVRYLYAGKMLGGTPYVYDWASCSEHGTPDDDAIVVDFEHDIVITGADAEAAACRAIAARLAHIPDEYRVDVEPAEHRGTPGYRVQVFHIHPDGVEEPTLSESGLPWRRSGLWRATEDGSHALGVSEAHEMHADWAPDRSLLIRSGRGVVVDTRQEANL
jgi:hypothetical protein